MSYFENKALIFSCCILWPSSDDCGILGVAVSPKPLFSLTLRVKAADTSALTAMVVTGSSTLGTGPGIACGFDDALQSDELTGSTRIGRSTHSSEVPSRGDLGGDGIVTGIGVIDGSADEVPCRLDRRLRTLLALLMNLSNLGDFSPAVLDVASPGEAILFYAPEKMHHRILA